MGNRRTESAKRRRRRQLREARQECRIVLEYGASLGSGLTIVEAKTRGRVATQDIVRLSAEDDADTCK